MRLRLSVSSISIFLYILSGILLLLTAAIGIFSLYRATPPVIPESPELSTPLLLLESLGPDKTPLFFTPDALPWLSQNARLCGRGFRDYKESGLTLDQASAQFVPTLQAPAAWRALDRKWRFGAILLTGDPRSFRPLLDHLRQSPDWTLSALGPTGYLFQRSPAPAWSPEDIEPLLARFITHSPREARLARLRLAHRLLYIGQWEPAHQLLQQALEADERSVEAWVEMGSYYALQSRWQLSVDAARRALALKENYPAALFLEATGLLNLGRNDEALDRVRLLGANSSPDDAEVLLLTARVAHAARAYQDEVGALQALVSQLTARSQPAGVWRLFLGQAYAALGDVQNAARQLQSASEDATLTDNQRLFIKKGLERLGQQRGFLEHGIILPQPSLLETPK